MKNTNSPDTRIHYKNHQQRWEEFSREVIDSLAGQIEVEGGVVRYTGKPYPIPFLAPDTREIVTFESILHDLADKRATIGSELNHNEKMGVFQGEMYEAWETFSRPTQDNNPWPSMDESVANAMDSLTASIMDKGEKVPDPYDGDYECYNLKNGYCLMMKEQKKDGQVIQRSFLMPDLDNVIIKAKTLKSKPDQTTYIIKYKCMNKYDFAKELEIYNKLFEQAMISDVSNGPRAFLEPLAKLMYLYARQLPLQRGSAGVAQWIMEAMAQNKGIALGDFSFEDKISWDFKALLTLPNSEDVERGVDDYVPKDYIDWFCDRLLPGARLIKMSHSEVDTDRQEASEAISKSLVGRVMASVAGMFADNKASGEEEESRGVNGPASTRGDEQEPK